MQRKTKLIVALDVESFSEAKHFVDILYPKVKIFKVGLQLFTNCGRRIIKYLKDKGACVFLDLKFFDIPNTVANACRQVVRLKVDIFTLHTQGGLEMLKKARQAVEDEGRKLRVKVPLTLGVTILTSEENQGKISTSVLGLAQLAKDAGLEGVVCSAQEAGVVRKKFGRDFIIVTPGIRLLDAKKQDQKRTATPEEAVKAGSDYLVVGRPILEAKDPLLAVKKILDEVVSR